MNTAITTRLSTTVGALLLALACGQIDPPPPVDDDGDPIPLPDPLDEWLQFSAFEPEEELSIRPTIAITFNAYLDPTTFNSYATARLVSRDLAYPGRIDYRITRRQILFRPNSNLEPDLRYELIWTADNIESVTGSPLHPLAGLPEFETDDELPTSPPLERPEVSWQEVEALFDAHCNDCHSDPDWQLPELTPESLVGRRSQQVDSLLVEPFHPARSYLMHKILPDYPVRRFTVQPPPWSDRSPLSTDDIERIEHWIANGAHR